MCVYHTEIHDLNILPRKLQKFQKNIPCSKKTNTINYRNTHRHLFSTQYKCHYCKFQPFL